MCYGNPQMLVNPDLGLLEAEEKSQQTLRERIRSSMASRAPALG